MIKANELKIGNWVKLGKNYEFVYQIIYDRQNGYSINHKDCKEEFFEPIELTPDILIKCGSKLTESDDMEFGVFKLRPRGRNTWSVYRDYSDTESDYFTDVQYLHQFQNLYFSLKYEELEINLIKH